MLVRLMVCLILAMAFLLVFVIPRVLQAYTRLNSDRGVSMEKVIGTWVQIGSNASLIGNDRDLSSFSAYAIFKDGGEYYLRYKCGDSIEESSGTWHYCSERWYFLRILPFGYRNWIKLDFDHQADPQFYVMTDNNGNIRMHRALYWACISENEFVRIE